MQDLTHSCLQLNTQNYVCQVLRHDVFLINMSNNNANRFAIGFGYTYSPLPTVQVFDHGNMCCIPNQQPSTTTFAVICTEAFLICLILFKTKILNDIKNRNDITQFGVSKTLTLE